VAVCRELTKLYEEIFRGKLSEAVKHFSQPRGEFTLVIAGAAMAKPEVNMQVEEELATLFKQGFGAREAVARLSSKTGLPKKKLYQAWLRLSKGE
jgi:16S rRNA (cytidine1402-2'-O)-methyltransferase